MSPEFSNRPLFATQSDAELFVDREKEIELILRSIAHHYNVIILGKRGSGRTSLLHQIYYRISQEENLLPIPCDSQIFREHETNFLRMLISCTLTALERHGRRTEGILEKATSVLAAVGTSWPASILKARQSLSSKEISSIEELDTLNSFENLLVELSDRYGQVVFLVDNLGEDIELFRKTFTSLRDYLWSLRAIFVVTADQSNEQSLLRPPIGAFFETIVRLRNFTEEETIEALSARDLQDEDLASQIYAVSHGHPLTTMLLARRVEQGELDRKELKRLAERTVDLFSNLEGLEGRIVRYIAERGPVSASDKDFQRTMGVSRARLVQVLQRLEEESLITSRRRGRRVYYSLTHGTTPSQEDKP